MTNAAQEKIQEHIQKMIKDLDKTSLRKMQVSRLDGTSVYFIIIINTFYFFFFLTNKADMHRCAANCCDQMQLPIEEVHNCVSKCSNELNKAQSYISKELTNFQVNI